ncbi:MAG: GerMN domain-containing protein [Clostridiaceae bacterium]|nr:GerMN domain-containing protein [Clostridiaceae bacterium]
MKKLLFISFLIFFLVFLSSCADKNVDKSSTKPSEQTTTPQVTKPSEQSTDTPVVTSPLTIKDYFSFKENTKYVYEGKGNEFASYTVLVDYLTERLVQLRTNNGGTETVKVLENKEGNLTMLLSRGETYFRENLTTSPSTKVEILLKEPLIKGTTWTLSDNRKRYISNIEFEVTTPSGKYKTIEVTTEGKDDKILDYYAPNQGLVKTVFVSKGSEVSSTLSKIEKNSPLTQTVKFYYPNVNENKLYFVNKKLTFNTNDITKIIFEKAFKDLPKGNLGKVLGTNVKIKSLYLNKDKVVYVDFTKELVSEMNAGSSYESMILQSITNTLGTYYGVEKVYITIEGNPYTSGHIVMKKGEVFTVNVKDAVELK